MKKIEYAIVDIETTGGSAQHHKITEIAILIHDGEKIIDTYETLINPEIEIPFSISMLTGITNEMTEDAPTFEEVAEEIHSYLNNRIFVAHHVNFDHSFIKEQLEECGFKFSPKKLCTVRLSRKLKPGFSTYSLGTLCHNLNIPIENRHRAMGDAAATALLFSKLVKWDTDGHIEEMLKKDSKEQQLPPHLPKEDFEKLPQKTGVYYFHDQAGKIIYVGKANNLRKRVASHFTGHNPNAQRQAFLENIYSISFEVCATELMALLLECSEIKKFWPKYNRALKKYEAKYALYTYTDINGCRRLVMGKHNSNQIAIQKFYREIDGINALLDWIERYNIDIRLCYFGQQVDSFDISANIELANKELPSAEEHNTKVEQLEEDLASYNETYTIINKGRVYEELSCIWIEKGRFYGMGYIDKNSDLNTLEEIKGSLTNYNANHYMMHLILKYIEKYPEKVVKVETEVI